ncbi:hypothetical protein ACH5RR_023657 [Cinchona calisaya]|uniref:Protein FAR1-RELATED SEQUENCE n=1 Tax=Cinchona calisaya TaxID=153742 RepID=A0ABD2ZBA2_9GENT
MVNIKLSSSSKADVAQKLGKPMHTHAFKRRCSDERKCNHCRSRLEQVLHSINKVTYCNNDVIILYGNFLEESESVTLVIDSHMNGILVPRMMIDNRTAVNILPANAMKRLGKTMEYLVSTDIVMSSFTVENYGYLGHLTRGFEAPFEVDVDEQKQDEETFSRMIRNKLEIRTHSTFLLSHVKNTWLKHIINILLSNLSYITVHDATTIEEFELEWNDLLVKHILVVFVKKSLVDCFPKDYILNRWTINAKTRGSGEIIERNLEKEPQYPFALVRNNLIMEFLKIVELGYGSQQKLNHVDRALKVVQNELLTMDDDTEDQTRDHDPTTSSMLKSSNEPIVNQGQNQFGEVLPCLSNESSLL